MHKKNKCPKMEEEKLKYRVPTTLTSAVSIVLRAGREKIGIFRGQFRGK